MADDADFSAAAAATSLGLLGEAEALLAARREAFDAEALACLQTIAASHPDIGGHGAGEAAAELMLLTEQMIAAGRHEADPVAVFLQAWRLLQTKTPDAEAKFALMRGLKSLRGRYEAAEAA